MLPFGINELPHFQAEDPLCRAVILACWSGGRKKQDVALTLVIALPMVIVHIFVEHISQGVFAEQQHLRQRFLFDRSYPALRISIQIRRPRWQRHPFDAGMLDDLLKGRAVFPALSQFSFEPL